MAKNEKGYGRAGLPGTRKTVFAHRLAYEIFRGPLLPGVCLLHTCDNPACCNPDHMRPGDRAMNNEDMLVKGHHRPGGTKTAVHLCKYERGEQHHAAKLTIEIVIAIRRRYRAGGTSYARLARQFGIKPQHIGKIVRRELWANI